MFNQANGLYEFGSYRLDAAKRLLTRSGESIALAPKTFDLLLLLIRGHGRVLTKTELMTALWPDTFVEEASLSYQVATLRKALGSEADSWIETVPKHGYRFAAAIATVPQEHEPGDGNSMVTTSPSVRKSPRMAQDVVEATAIRAARVRERLVIGTASVLAIALMVAGAGWWRAAHPVDRPLTRFSVDLGPDALPGPSLTAAISPDGRRLVFAARGPDGKQLLATRLLDQAHATLLPGTEDGSDPFFSPDGQWIGFSAGTELRKISVGGGAPVTLAFGASPSPRGASWGMDGNIIAALGNVVPLSRVPAAGGPAQPLTKLRPGEASQRWPQVLSVGDAVLFTVTGSPSDPLDNGDIEAISVTTRQVKMVLRGAYFARYLPGGYLVYVRRGVLFGVRFDPARLEVRGGPTPLVEDLASNPITGGGQFDFSSTGTFVYAAGKAATQALQFTWLDSSRNTEQLFAAPGAYGYPRLSPDGRKLAFGGDGPDVYVHDLERDMITRLTFTGNADVPVWTPDGKHIVFRSISNENSLHWIRSDSAGNPQRLLASQNYLAPWSFSPDGRRLAY